MDIYTLPRLFIPQRLNVLTITFFQAEIIGCLLSPQDELVCHQCSATTLFLHDTAELSRGYLCPVCVYPFSRKCGLCYKKLGCDSCGENESIMVQIEHGRNTVLLCNNNNCLMPFGYQVSSESVECSCHSDALKSLESKMIPELHNILCEFTSNQSRAKSRPYPTLLPDFTATLANQCFPCQINKKYKRAHTKVSGSKHICKCCS